MKYTVITTEIYNATYVVDANSEEEAIQSARLSDDPIRRDYNEPLRDRKSMYVVKLPDWDKGEKVADVVEKWCASQIEASTLSFKVDYPYIKYHLEGEVLRINND